MTPGRAHTPLNILLVDDTPSKLLTYEVMLKDLGENLVKASSAEEALQLLLKTDVALILTDVSMPALDGFGLANVIKDHPRFATTSIIFVTANALSHIDQLKGYASGAVDYVTVPVAPELLRAKVKVFLELHRKRLELEQLKAELEGRVARRTAELQAYAARLAASEERYRTLVDNATDIVATLDLDLRFTSVNPAVERMGYTTADIVGQPLSRFIPRDQVALHHAALGRGLGGEPIQQYEMQLVGRDGHQIFTLEASSRLIRDQAGQPVGLHAIARDITERKQADARQLLLVRELQHRTKNMLAIVQSIATNTLSRSADLQSAQDAFLGRLHALAHAQDFVAAGAGGGVPLRQLVDAELAPFVARASVTGEPVIVGVAFAQLFALVVHELATNAARHGAISTPAGTVAITWTISNRDQDPHLSFSWVERGGPPAKLPTRRGLGTELISLLGQSELTFAEEGLRYDVNVPFHEASRGTAQGRAETARLGELWAAGQLFRGGG